jgi:RecB family exonuclease
MGYRSETGRYYYEMLFRRSKEVAISFSTASQNEGSMFLKQLGVKTLPIEDEANYASLLFTPSTHATQNQEPIVLDYSFKDKKLSATKLKTFLECKRRYYYRYEAKIQPHSIPKDISKEHEIGILLHLGLKNLYTKQNSFSSKDELINALGFELDALTANDKFQSYQLKLYKKRLEAFCVNEIERFSQGYEVFGCELPLSGAFYGAQLEGNIDRIDKKDAKLYILDYKSGSINSYTEKTVLEATDFQLEFYHLLASQLGTVSGCGYYDLQNGKVIAESLLEQKLDLLRSIITDLLAAERVEFEMCEDPSKCRFCDNATICQRA